MSIREHSDVVAVAPADAPAATSTALDREAAELTLRAHLARNVAVAVAVALSILAVFVPALILTYAFSDDYVILFLADHLGSTTWYGDSLVGTISASGRPLASVLDQLVFSAAGSVDNLRFVRLGGVVGIVLLALLLHWALVRSKVPVLPAAAIAAAACMLPAFQIYGTWTGLFNAPYAAILAGCASIFAAKALERRKELLVDRLAGAAALLVAALMIYQPAAMFFWVFLAVAVVGTVPDSRRALRLAALHVGVAGVAAVLALIVRRIAVGLADRTVPNARADVFEHHPLSKLSWFIHQPLYWSLNLFDLSPNRWLAFGVVSVALIGVVFGLAVRKAPIVPYVAIGLVLLPVSLTPNLAVIGEQTTYRMQAALGTLVVLYFGLGALCLWVGLVQLFQARVGAHAARWIERLGLAAALGFVVVVGAAAASNVVNLIVVPQHSEYEAMRDKIAALPPGVARVGYVVIGWNQGFQQRYISDEFIPSSAQPFVAEPAVALALRDEGRLASGQPPPIVDEYPFDTTGFPKTEPVIDMRNFNSRR